VKLTVLVEESGGQPNLVAKHGLSVLIETSSAESEPRILMDTGSPPYLALHNAKVMKLDIGSGDAIIISHGHYDHVENVDLSECEDAESLVTSSGEPFLSFLEEVRIRRIVFVSILRVPSDFAKPFCSAIPFPVADLVMRVEIVARHGMSAYLDRKPDYFLYVVSVILNVGADWVACEVTAGEVDNLGTILLHVRRCRFKSLAGAAAASHPSHNLYGFVIGVFCERSVSLNDRFEAFIPCAGSVPIAYHYAYFDHAYSKFGLCALLLGLLNVEYSEAVSSRMARTNGVHTTLADWKPIEAEFLALALHRKPPVTRGGTTTKSIVTAIGTTRSTMTP
jgi:hypothetical protein